MRRFQRHGSVPRVRGPSVFGASVLFCGEPTLGVLIKNPHDEFRRPLRCDLSFLDNTWKCEKCPRLPPFKDIWEYSRHTRTQHNPGYHPRHDRRKGALSSRTRAIILALKSGQKQTHVARRFSVSQAWVSLVYGRHVR